MGLPGTLGIHAVCWSYKAVFIFSKQSIDRRALNGWLVLEHCSEETYSHVENLAFL